MLQICVFRGLNERISGAVETGTFIEPVPLLVIAGLAAPLDGVDCTQIIDLCAGK